jgi:hypothetical protein
MLHEFITSYRDAIIDRTREKMTDRPWPLASTSELEHGVPLFLAQLSDTLRLEATRTSVSQHTIGASAAKHGGELRALGFNISQVAHDYGDICQAITEIAVERQLPITTAKFHHAESAPVHRRVRVPIQKAVEQRTTLYPTVPANAQVEPTPLFSADFQSVSPLPVECCAGAAFAP